MIRRIAIIVLAVIAAGGCSSDHTANQPLPLAPRQDEIARLQAVTQRGGDAILGRHVFNARCAACHTAFGQGGDLGPDLTPYLRRENYRQLLLTTLLTPSGQAAASHATRSLTLKDGKTYTGVILQDAAGQLTLAVPGGNRVTLAKTNLDPAADTTPRHLLAGLTDQQVRNLFAYLLREAPARR